MRGEGPSSILATVCLNVKTNTSDYAWKHRHPSWEGASCSWGEAACMLPPAISSALAWLLLCCSCSTGFSPKKGVRVEACPGSRLCGYSGLDFLPQWGGGEQAAGGFRHLRKLPPCMVRIWRPPNVGSRMVLGDHQSVVHVLKWLWSVKFEI